MNPTNTGDYHSAVSVVMSRDSDDFIVRKLGDSEILTPNGKTGRGSKDCNEAIDLGSESGSEIDRDDDNRFPNLKRGIYGDCDKHSNASSNSIESMEASPKTVSVISKGKSETLTSKTKTK